MSTAEAGKVLIEAIEKIVKESEGRVLAHIDAVLKKEAEDIRNLTNTQTAETQARITTLNGKLNDIAKSVTGEKRQTKTTKTATATDAAATTTTTDGGATAPTKPKLPINSMLWWKEQYRTSEEFRAKTLAEIGKFAPTVIADMNADATITGKKNVEQQYSAQATFLWPKVKDLSSSNAAAKAYYDELNTRYKELKNKQDLDNKPAQQTADPHTPPAAAK